MQTCTGPSSRAQITCRGLVQAYLDRAKAYNGVSDRLVTRDGAPIPAATGTVRAGSPLKFPTETVAISTLLPDSTVRRAADRAGADGARPPPIPTCSSSTA